MNEVKLHDRQLIKHKTDFGQIVSYQKHNKRNLSKQVLSSSKVTKKAITREIGKLDRTPDRDIPWAFKLQEEKDHGQPTASRNELQVIVRDCF